MPEEPTREELLLTIQRLQQEVQALQRDKADLEILLETTTEHSDLVEAELQNQAESAIREGERRLAQFLEAVPVGVFVADALGQPYYSNQAAQRLLGKGAATTTSVQHLAEAYQVYVAGTEQLYPNAQMPVVQALSGNSSTRDDLEIRRDEGVVPLEVWASPIFDQQGQVVFAIAAFQDITERKRAEAQLRMAAQRDRLLAEMSQRIRQSLDLEQILSTTVSEIRQFLQTDRVCICHIDPNWRTQVVAESVVADQTPLLGLTVDNPIFSREMWENFEQGVRAIDDLSQIPVPQVSAQILQHYGVRACLGVPIVLEKPSAMEPNGSNGSEKYADQEFWLLVAHQCSGPRHWHPFEIGLLDQLGNQVTIAIQQANLYQQLAAANANTEESLRESEERLRTLINATPDIICFKDGAGRWLESNQANLRFLALEGVDYKGKTDAELLHYSEVYRNAWPGCSDTDELAWKQGSTCRVEECVPLPDGTVQTFDMIKAPLFYPNGQRKGLLVLGRDITDRKHLEEELWYRAQAQSLLSSISRQFMDQDLNPAIQFILREVAQFLGTERSYLFEYTEDHSQFYLTHEWCAADAVGLPVQARQAPVSTWPWFNQQIRSGQPVQWATLSELPPMAQEAFRQQGTQSLLAVPTVHAGKVFGFLGVDVIHGSRSWSQQDLSFLKLVGELIAIGRARHQAEAALRTAKEVALCEAARSAKANRAKSVFLANMSHELRTPLNAILGFAQLMEREDSLSPRQQEFLEIINRSGEHLLNLINDVLEMSKIEAGRIVLNPAPFDLQKLLQTLQDLFQTRAEAKGLTLQFEIPPNLPQSVLADGGKLRQVLINLLSNAVKFTDAGGVTVRVQSQPAAAPQFLQAEAEAGAFPQPEQPSYLLHFEVEDTGRGIAVEEINGLFQPFFQTTSGNQTQEGTGLGLAISRQFVQLMGGTIDCSSTVGQGTTFCFQIPVALPVLPVIEAQPLTENRVLGLAPDQPTYRILVVDDRPENRMLIEALLQAVGFETRAAENGQEAIAQWQQWQPHLIWMDMRMPVLDGYEATRQIRALEQAQPAASPTVILALTASAFEEQRRSILSAGCNDWVCKPFREAVIFEKMATYLGVQYLYDESDQPSASASAWADGLLTGDELSVMPPAWIAALHQAALEVDADQLHELINQIPPGHFPLAQKLKALVHQFCFDEILSLYTSPEVKSLGENGS